MINFIVFLFYWFTQVLTYIGLPIELESVGGPIYLILGIFALLELFGSFLGSVLSLKYDFLYVFKGFIYLTTILFMFFFIYPVDFESQSSLKIAFFVILSFIIKLAYDTSWHLFGMYLPNLFTTKFYGLYLVIVVPISRFSLVFLPYLNNIPKGLGLHPFTLYCVFWFITGILIQYSQILYKKKKSIGFGGSGFEMKGGIVAETQEMYDLESSQRLLIKRENKLKRFVELKENLIPESNEDIHNEVTTTIDSTIKGERRTLVFEGLKLPEPLKKCISIKENNYKNSKNLCEKIDRDSIKEEFQRESLKNLPIIYRKNVVQLKRKPSHLDVSEIIKNENRIGNEKMNLYLNNNALIKDDIHEEMDN